MGGYANFEVGRNKSHKGTNIFEKGKNFNKESENLTKSQKLMNGVALWASFYKENPHRFAKDYLNIHLKEFQQLIIWGMFHNNYSMFMAARGLGKTWITAVYCIIRCILYPGSKIVVASGVISQAMKIVTEKIPEIMQNSPMLKREILDIQSTANSDKPNVMFHNGSWIKVVPSTENARSARANVLILDEFRLIDFKIYKDVLRRFLAASRQPRYLIKNEYSHLQERNIEIFLSSCKYKFEWSYDRFKVFYNSMLQEKKYFVCGLPYQISIMSGLVMKAQLQDEINEEDWDGISWLMEMECKFFGESEKAYFKLDKIEACRRNEQPFYLPSVYNSINDKNFILPLKKANEKRILSCDIATISGDANDASVFSLIQLLPNKNNTAYIRNVVYIENVVGGHTVYQALKIRYLYEYFQCDNIVLDTQNAGISIFDSLCTELVDKENDIVYEPLSCINDEDIAKRCQFNEAKKVIYSIKGHERLNSDIAIALQDCILRNKIKFLVNDNNAYEFLYKLKGFHTLSPEQQVELLLPYKQTSALVNEMLNLEQIPNDKGLVKLKEPRGKRKDRYTSVSYSNYIIGEIERDTFKKARKDFNWMDYCLY